MDPWSFVRVIVHSVWLFILALPTSHVTAEPTIATRLLRGERNALTLECETKINPHRDIIQLKNGEQVSAVNASGTVTFTSQDVTHVKVTESSGLRQVHTEVTNCSQDTVFTCSTLISVTNGTFLSNYTRQTPMINQTDVETPEDLSVEISPEYVLFSENARLYGSVEFMCVSNFISLDTETFRWSLTSTSTGKELLDDELVGISNTGVFVEIDSSPKVSTFRLNGLNFPTVPDDLEVKCSARLNADASYVTASAIVQVTNKSTLLRRKRIIIFLGCATCTFFVVFVVATIVICVMRKKNWSPEDPATPSPSSSPKQGHWSSRDEVPSPQTRGSIRQANDTHDTKPVYDEAEVTTDTQDKPEIYDDASVAADLYQNIH